MSEPKAPPPAYSIWQVLFTAHTIAQRALEEVRALGAGPRGEPGPQGERGPPGPAGRFAAPSPFNKGDVFYEGALVFYEGSTYCARRDTAQEPPHQDWVPVAVRGDTGQPAPQPEPKGLFDPDKQYRELNIVAFGGASWIATMDDPAAEIPGDGWLLLAQKGKRGDRGERGDRGPQGLPGPPGTTISDLHIEDWSLVVQMSDGKTARCDLRALFERYQQEAGN